MQRRLTVAMAAIALAAVGLVGAGVLVLAQIGARQQTEDEVVDQLDVLANLMVDSFTDNGRGRLDRLRQAFDFNRLELVVVESDGRVTTAGVGRFGRGPAMAVTDGGEFERLADDDLERLRAGEAVLTGVEEGGTTEIRGIRLVDLPVPRLGGGGTDPPALGLVVSRTVVTIAPEARLWFVVSATVVLAGSLLVAWLLARRLLRPIQSIEHATAAIAAGDLGARVAVDGNDELAHLGRSVNRMAEDLARSRALDRQFLMSVSHDLRTPLTAIAGYGEALREGAAPDPAQAGEIILNHAGRLDRLIGDLLDLAKLDANRFTLAPRPVDIGVAVGRTVAGLVPRAAANGVDLLYRPGPRLVVDADPDRVAQVVANLVDNAITFANTTVTTAAAADGDRAVVTVADDGPGIAAHDLPHVFDRLYTGGAQPPRDEKPTGMGLAIVRELTLAMGGTVDASSPPEGGTILTLCFPLSGNGDRPGRGAAT